MHTLTEIKIQKHEPLTSNLLNLKTKHILAQLCGCSLESKTSNISAGKKLYQLDFRIFDKFAKSNKKLSIWQARKLEMFVRCIRRIKGKGKVLGDLISIQQYFELKDF